VKRRVLRVLAQARRRGRGLARLRATRRAVGKTALAIGLSLLGVALWRSRLLSPDPTLLLRDRNGRFLGEVSAQGATAEFGYWPLEAVPPRVAAATLLIEDRRFRSHPGVDPLALGRAAVQNLRQQKRTSGASTLAMQVARMQHPGSRTYGRKALEALSAIFMTAFHGRDAVLTHYLRLVPYGNRIHGIGYAARRYLDKPVEDLSWAETAFLCAIPQAPAQMNPFTPGGRERAVRRGERILDLLLEGGRLGRDEHALARAQILTLRVPPVEERPRASLHFVLRFEEWLKDPARRQRLGAHPLLETSLDLDLQEEAQDLALRTVRGFEAQGAGNAALVLADRATGEILAWVGSTDYFDAAHAGAIDYARVPRSPGSALKPFLYALALERRTITPATILDDLDRGPGGITNADDLYLGPLLPRVALANSRNVPAAELLDQVGLDEGYAFLRDLGLHEGQVPARRLGLGLAIGGLNVTLERLVRAYSVLAGEGRLFGLVAVKGEPAERRRLLSEDTARQVNLFLSDPQARLPTFARMGSLEYPFPAAVKTGTSSRYRDAWAVAFTTRYLVGVWVGDPDFRPMNRISGYQSAAALAQRLLLRLHPGEAQGLHDLTFPQPRGHLPVRLCALTGARATEACDRVAVEWLRPGEEPRHECRAHVRLLVDTRTGRPATQKTPRVFVEPRTFVDLEPRYAAWAEAALLPRPPMDDAPVLSFASARPTVRVSFTSPADGLRLLRDPETPAGNATLSLAAVVDPEGAEVVFYVDGAPFAVVGPPYRTRWPLAPGEHVFEARVPRARAVAPRVRVLVQ
jgi:penicillin-binding protein 1C